MNIQELKGLVKKHTGRDVTIELGRLYTCFDKETGEFVATYDPSIERLVVMMCDELEPEETHPDFGVYRSLKK